MLKKYTTLTLVSFLLTGVLAVSAKGNERVQRQKFNNERVKTGGEINVNGKTFIIGSPAQKNDRLKAKKVAPGYGDVIDNPSGKPQEYSKTSAGYYYYGNVNAYQDYGQAATIYWDNDEAYILNILSYKETDSYVLGNRKGNVLNVPMNQTVDMGDGFGVNLGLLKTVLTLAPNSDWEEGDDEDSKNTIYIDFVYSEDYNSVDYLIGENGSLSLQLPGLKGDVYEGPDDGYQHIDPAIYGFPYYALGFYFTDDLTWSGDCDIFQEYEEFNYPLVTTPANLDYKYYSYINDFDNGVLVNVAKDGDVLYFKGLSEFAPDAVFKANIIETDKGLVASVPQNQYIGKTEDGYYNLVTRTLVYDPSERDFVLAPADVDATFFLELDPATGEFLTISADPSVNILVFNYADEYYDPYDEFPGITLKYQSTLDGTPQNPEGAYYEDHTDWLGAYYLFFYLTPFTKEGTMLDVNNLYYRIFIDGEPYEFVQHEGDNLSGQKTILYYGVTKPTTLIPYTFYNGMDLFYDEYHLYYVGIYQHGVKTIGVQLVYTYGDEPTYSDLITLDVSGVETIPADAVSHEYYDLNGLRVTNPGKGLYIVRSVLSDGSVKISKVAK